jgi:CDP-glucose 4,6-dehydratase
MSEKKTDWCNRRVLVTGATGLVGSRLVHRLLGMGAWVVCLVRDQDPSSPLWLSGDIDRVAVADGRLECFETVRAALSEREVDTVFHLGAQAIVGVGRRDPIGTFESNIRGTWNLLEACRVYAPGVRRIVIASSDKAYGDSDQLPYVESMALAARNPYDVSKSCADLLSQSYASSYGLPIAIARCGNIFGPGDLNFSRLIPGTIRSFTQGRRPQIRSSGLLIREYLYLDDAVSGYLALSDWLDTPAYREQDQKAFNFGTGEGLTVLEVVTRVAQAMGCEELEPVVLDSARGEILEQRLDWSRAKSILGWAPRLGFAAAIHETVRWYCTYFAARERFRTSADSLAIPQHAARASA